MAGCSPVLLGFLLLFFYYPSCQSLMTINYYDYTIYFDDNNFQLFHECLCGFNTRRCDATSYWAKDYRTLYDITNIGKEINFVPEAYYKSYSYNCTSYRDVNIASIVCKRRTRSILEDEPDPYMSCENVPVNMLLVSCSSECFEILWEDSENITNIDTDTELLGCGLCQTETSTTTTTKSTTATTTPTTTTTKPPTTAVKPTTTTTIPTTTTAAAITTSTTPTIDRQKDDDPSEDNIPLIAGVVVAVIVILIITGLIIVIIWWRRKRNLNPPSTHHSTTSTRAIPQNYADTGEVHGYVNVNGHGPSATNPFAGAENESMTTDGPGPQSDQAVVFPEEAIQKIRRAPAKSSDIGKTGTEYSSIDEVVSPENGYYNTCNIGDSPVSSSATPLSTNSTAPSQPTNRNTSGYEEVDVHNMTTRPGVPINHYEEIPDQAYGDNKDGSKALKEPYYTNAL